MADEFLCLPWIFQQQKIWNILNDKIEFLPQQFQNFQSEKIFEVENNMQNVHQLISMISNF